nr:hypothetical protein [Pseudofrankia sp. DC12]
MVQAAENPGVRAEVETAEVGEGDQAAVADVEEEVRRAGVAAVLDQLGQRELQQPLVDGSSARRRG